MFAELVCDTSHFSNFVSGSQMDVFCGCLILTLVKKYFEVTEMNEPEDKYAWTVTVGEKGQIVRPKTITPKEAFDKFLATAYSKKEGDEKQ